MRPSGGEPTFDPSRFRPAFTRELIVEHLRDVVGIVEEIDPPADLRLAVFGVAQAMWSSMQPVDTAVEVANGAMAPSLKLRR